MNAPRPDPVKGLISLLQLLQEAREAVSRRELGFIMVNRTFELLRYDTALFWSRDRLGRVRIEAISGAPDFDRKARRVAKLERRIAEFAKKSGAGDFQKIIKDDTDAGERSPENILWCPLGHSRRRVDCGLWLTSASDWSDGDIDAMGHLCGAYSHAMNAVGDRPRSKLLGEWALKLSFVLALGLAAWAMTIPVEQTVLASATIVARDPVMITAPQSGVIKAINIQPNASVTAGQILFTLDATDARSRYEVGQQTLQVARAELFRAQQLAFSNIESKSKLPLLRARIEEQTEEVAYAKTLLEQTIIRAPRNGIAVFTDAGDWIGRPVSVGEKIMTVADSRRVEVELQLPVDNMIDLPPSARVQTFLNVAPLEPFDGTLRSASYHASPTPEGFLAYRLKATLADGDKVPRIGLKGTAKIYGQRVSLFFYLFRRPLIALRQLVGI